MKAKVIKKLGITFAIAAFLGAGMVYQGLIPLSFAAEDEHGHPHGHEDGEESHGEGRDEHGHAHEAKPEQNHGEGEDEHGHGEEGHDEGALKLSPEQMSASGVKTVIVRQGSLSHQVSVPGRIVADADRMAQIVPKVSGVVVEARKNLGDTVEKDEVLALIESREMAEAAAEYQAASRAAELARTTHNREKTLWEKKVTAEQDYLSAKNAWQEAQIRLDLAKQKMQTLGGTADKGTPSRYHELKSPLNGLVVERELTLGEFVDTSHKAFTVADLSVLWVETAIAPDDLSNVKEGQEAYIEGSGKNGTGKLIFVSPVIDPDTRSAKAIIELMNPDGKWRSGDYTNASIVTGTQQVGIVAPKDAVQTIEGKPFVFVKSAEEFEKRSVVIGKKDNNHIEILSGLQPGEEIAIGNTFVLKAEAGKAEAEHSH
jgi:cobalt-zinc-cadmium efflux system membrane fusion protein